VTKQKIHLSNRVLVIVLVFIDESITISFRPEVESVKSLNSFLNFCIEDGNSPNSKTTHTTVGIDTQFNMGDNEILFAGVHIKMMNFISLFEKQVNNQSNTNIVMKKK
jgi:hypothetical protein